MLFVAGGIGITPLLPMVEDAVRRNADWQLLYGGRSRTSMAFLDVLTAHGDRVEVRPQDEYGLLDLAGFVGRMPTAPIYACGPTPMLDALQAVCAGAERQLHVERFAPAPEALPDHPPDAAFDVVLARSGQTLHVGADDTILDVIEATGLNPAWSCREGTCGTCETKILAGRPDHRDFVLSEDERADEDTMMICVSRARTPSLTLDM
jgi:ferredoxin-NADP reductase